MSPCCNLDLEGSNNKKLRHNPLANGEASLYQIWKQNVLWFIRHHLDKHSLAFWTFSVTLTLNTVIPFFHWTLQLMMLYYQTKLGCKPTSSLADTTKIVILLLYKPSLWPWHWTQWTNFSVSIPGLATKCSVVQKISSGKTFTNILNLCYNLDLERSNLIFKKDTLVYGGVLSNQVWLKMDQ